MIKKELIVIKANLTTIAKVFLFWFVFTILLNTIGALMPISPNWLLGTSFGGCVSLAMTAATYFILKSEKQSLKSIGISVNSSSLHRYILSLVAGMVFFGCFYLVFLWLTPVAIMNVQNNSIITVVLLSILSLTMLSIMEEVAFRGYALQKLDSAIGTRGAIYLTSLAFGLYHGLVFESITGPAVWGLIYAVLAYWSKGLAVPIGFHAGANIIQALFSEKPRYADGLWSFDLVEKVTPFTVEQTAIYMKIFMFMLGVLLVEFYLYQRNKPAIKNGNT
jgi:membrane protease YdiL (CAAX protease family)